MKIGFAMCGSFCTFAKVFPVMETLAKTHTVIPIFSQTVSTIDSRFGEAKEFASKAEAIIDLVKEFGVLELVRTGMVALERGADTIYEATKEKGEFDYGKNVL